MSKLHKLEMYIVDSSDMFNSIEDIMNYLDFKTHDLFFELSKSKTSEFEWDDDLKINKNNCTIQDYEEYFKED